MPDVNGRDRARLCLLQMRQGVALVILRKFPSLPALQLRQAQTLPETQKLGSGPRLASLRHEIGKRSCPRAARAPSAFVQLDKTSATSCERWQSKAREKLRSRGAGADGGGAGKTSRWWGRRRDWGDDGERIKGRMVLMTKEKSGGKDNN